MSTQAQTNGAAAIRRYRGRNVAELLPRIQAELGPNAVVVGRRTGLEGGIAGFFQRPFVELEAKPGGGQLDLTDGEPALPDQEAQAAGQPDQGRPGQRQEERKETEPAAEESFEEALAQFSEELERKPAQAAPPAPSLQAPRRSQRARKQVIGELVERGFEEPFAEDLVERVELVLLPLSPKASLRGAVRQALARELPRLPLPAPAATSCVVGGGGAGKSSLLFALADRYQAAGLPVRTGAVRLGERGGRLSLVEGPTVNLQAGERPPLAQLAGGATVLLEVEGLHPAAASSIKALAPLLGPLSPGRLYLALPATLAGRAARKQLAAFRPLGPNAVAITHCDETDQLGVVVQAALEAGLPVELLLGGGPGDRALQPVDPETLARRLLP